MRKFFALLAVSCASPEPTVPLNGAAEDQFTVTQVVLENGVARVVATSTVTRAEQVRLAEQRLRAAEAGVTRLALAEDVTCYNDDLWMYDQYNSQGNELCLSGTGG